MCAGLTTGQDDGMIGEWFDQRKERKQQEKHGQCIITNEIMIAERMRHGAATDIPSKVVVVVNPRKSHSIAKWQ